jgi:hypothetical protein
MKNESDSLRFKVGYESRRSILRRAIQEFASTYTESPRGKIWGKKAWDAVEEAIDELLDHVAKPKTSTPQRTKMSFSEALELLKEGTPVRRAGWGGRLFKRSDGVFLDVDGEVSPWVPLGGQLLTNDWETFAPEPWKVARKTFLDRLDGASDESTWRVVVDAAIKAHEARQASKTPGSLEFGVTNRGFPTATFIDAYGQSCSLQKSSAVEPCVWLGVDNTGPHIDGPQGSRNEEVKVRMILTQEQAAKVADSLMGFSTTGDPRNTKEPATQTTPGEVTAEYPVEVTVGGQYVQSGEEPHSDIVFSGLSSWDRELNLRLDPKKRYTMHLRFVPVKP